MATRADAVDEGTAGGCGRSGAVREAHLSAAPNDSTARTSATVRAGTARRRQRSVDHTGRRSADGRELPGEPGGRSEPNNSSSGGGSGDDETGGRRDARVRFSGARERRSSSPRLDDYRVLAEQVRKARVLVSGVFLLLAFLSMVPVFLERDVQVTALIGLMLFIAGIVVRLYVGYVQQQERRMLDSASVPLHRYRRTGSRAAAVGSRRWGLPLDWRQRSLLPPHELRYLQIMQRLSMVDRDFTPQDYDILLELDAGNAHMQEFLRGAPQDAIDMLPCYSYREAQQVVRDKMQPADSGEKPGLSTAVAAAADETSRSDTAAAKRAEVDTTDVACVVCLERFCAEEKVRVLPCLHQFHRHCIDPWLRQQAQCPVCKADIV